MFHEAGRFSLLVTSPWLMDIGLLTLGLFWPNSNGTSFEGKALSLAGELKLQESTDPFAPLGLYLLKTTNFTMILR